jgi:hypothetical protein
LALTSAFAISDHSSGFCCGDDPLAPIAGAGDFSARRQWVRQRDATGPRVASFLPVGAVLGGYLRRAGGDVPMAVQELGAVLGCLTDRWRPAHAAASAPGACA